MKKDKIIYWISTGLIAAAMLMNGIAYFNDAHIIEEIKHLGFPDYFRIELGVAKVLGALVLILPFVPSKIKEFAYFGFLINFISAIVAHIGIKNPITEIIAPIVFISVLSISYTYFQKIK